MRYRRPKYDVGAIHTYNVLIPNANDEEIEYEISIKMTIAPSAATWDEPGYGAEFEIVSTTPRLLPPDLETQIELSGLKMARNDDWLYDGE